MGLNRLLTGADRRTARRHRLPQRRQAFLIASGLLRFALSEVLGRPAARIVLERRPGRRPRTLSPRWATPVALSVTHTQRWVMVGVLPGHDRLGVDLEEADRQPSPGLARRLPWPDTGSPAERLQRWTLVEAALKAHGRGLAGLRDIELMAADHPGWRFASGAWQIRCAALKGSRCAGHPAAVAAVALARLTPNLRVPSDETDAGSRPTGTVDPASDRAGR